MSDETNSTLAKPKPKKSRKKKLGFGLVPWGRTYVTVDESLAEIKVMLRNHGAERWSFPETLDGDIEIYFVYRGQNVMLPLRVKQMEKRLRNLYPREKIDEIRKGARMIVMRHAVNYFKVTFEVIEAGMFNAVEALLPHFVNKDGARIADNLLEMNPDMKRLLPPSP